MSEKDIVRLGVNLPRELRDKFKKIAIINDKDMGELVREWIEEYVSEYGAPTPNKFKKKKRIIRKPKVTEETGEDVTE